MSERIAFNIILILIFHVFFSRIFTYFFGLNFLNLINILLAPLVYFFFFWTYKDDSKKYYILFVITVFISGFINGINLINSIIYILILLFPFYIKIFLEIIVLKPNINYILEKFLLIFFIINLILSYYQFIRFGIGDDVKGVFIGMGAGHHINGAVCLLYSFLLFKSIYFSNKLLIFLNSLVVILSDSKQVILAIILGIIFYGIVNLLSLYNHKKLILKIKYFFFNFLLIFFLSLLFLIIYNLDILYINISYINYDYLFLGIVKKFQGLNYFNLDKLQSFLIGNGPGMTVSKLAYMANYEDTYFKLLNSLDYTFSKLSLSLLDLQLSDWQTDFRSTGSSLFQMTFTIGGIIGDVGFIGLLTYFGFLRKIVIFNIFNYQNNLIFYICISLGLIFSWLEEPNFMFIVILICFLIFKQKDNHL